MNTIKTLLAEKWSATDEANSLIIRTSDIKQVVTNGSVVIVYYDKPNTSQHRKQSEQGMVYLEMESATKLFDTHFVEFKFRKAVNNYGKRN